MPYRIIVVDVKTLPHHMNAVFTGKPTMTGLKKAEEELLQQINSIKCRVVSHFERVVVNAVEGNEKGNNPLVLQYQLVALIEELEQE